MRKPFYYNRNKARTLNKLSGIHRNEWYNNLWAANPEGKKAYEDSFKETERAFAKFIVENSQLYSMECAGNA